MAESLAGRLLVASPKLSDPNFFRTVVIICAHDENGALGVVLNRPLEEVDIGEHLPDWEAALTEPAIAFCGGPVEPTAAMALGRLRTGMADGPLTPVTAHVGIVNLGLSPAELGVELADLRIYLGYSGWGAGQLEAEIADEAWFVIPSRDSDPFTSDPEALYREVLQRQGGKLAMFAYFPADPSQN